MLIKTIFLIEKILKNIYEIIAEKRTPKKDSCNQEEQFLTWKQTSMGSNNGLSKLQRYLDSNYAVFSQP